MELDLHHQSSSRSKRTMLQFDYKYLQYADTPQSKKLEWICLQSKPKKQRAAIDEVSSPLICSEKMIRLSQMPLQL